MNLLLLEPDELDTSGRATLSGRRLLHAREVLKAAAGESLRVGVLGGDVGVGTVVELSAEQLVLQVALTAKPPQRPGVDLLLAIPRPKALKKVLPAVASLGVGRVVLVNALKVEKSYFDSKVLAPDAVRALLLLGLEQAQDTHLPEVHLKERFRPFVEDELDGLFGAGRPRWVCHPGPRPPGLPPRAPAVLAIGPEGGWIPFELELLAARGFTPLSLGPRTLRVETAVPYALGLLAAHLV